MGINLKKIGEEAGNTDFQPLPEDRYNVRISAAVLAKTKSDKDMITVTFDVTNGDYTNRKLWSNFTLTDKAYVYIYTLLKAVNSDLIDEEDVKVEAISGALIGGKCSIMAGIEMGTNGKARNTVSNYKSLEEAGDLANQTKSLFE